MTSVVIWQQQPATVTAQNSLPNILEEKLNDFSSDLAERESGAGGG